MDHVSSRSRVIAILYYLCLCRRVERKRRVIPRLRALNRREEGARVDGDELVAWWIGHRLHGIDSVDKVDGELGVFGRVELLVLQNKGCERVVGVSGREKEERCATLLRCAAVLLLLTSTIIRCASGVNGSKTWKSWPGRANTATAAIAPADRASIDARIGKR